MISCPMSRPSRSQSVASHTRPAVRNALAMALSFAALLPPVAGFVAYSPSGLSSTADQRFQPRFTSSGSHSSSKWPSAARMAP